MLKKGQATLSELGQVGKLILQPTDPLQGRQGDKSHGGFRGPRPRTEAEFCLSGTWKNSRFGLSPSLPQSTSAFSERSGNLAALEERMSSVVPVMGRAFSALDGRVRAMEDLWPDLVSAFGLVGSIPNRDIRGCTSGLVKKF